MDHFSYRCLRWILFSGLFFLSGGFLNATIHLVIFALVVRLFSARRERDYYFLAVIAFLMVLAAAVLTGREHVSADLFWLHDGCGSRRHPYGDAARCGEIHSSCQRTAR